MKKIIFTITTMLAANTMFAQMKEGTIIYEQKINMHRSIKDEQMRAMIPEFTTSKFQLLFSDSVSLYKSMPADETPDPFNSGGGATVIMKTMSDGGEQYRNFSQAREIDLREVGAKQYIVEDSIKPGGWKLTDGAKTILNYTCKKAIRQGEEGRPIVAWYTESIPCPGGPEVFGNLPGAILAVDINDGEIVFNATDVSDKVDKKEIKEPKKGKKVTKAEFAKLTEEVFGAQPHGGARVIRMVN